MSDEKAPGQDPERELYPDWARMIKRWPSSIVARSAIEEFTGGLLKPSHMANLDHLGQGPPHFRGVTKKVFYEVESLVDWMRQRFEAFQAKQAEAQRRKEDKPRRPDDLEQ
jgi:hypothetical protein